MELYQLMYLLSNCKWAGRRPLGPYKPRENNMKLNVNPGMEKWHEERPTLNYKNEVYNCNWSCNYGCKWILHMETCAQGLWEKDVKLIQNSRLQVNTPRGREFLYECGSFKMVREERLQILGIYEISKSWKILLHSFNGFTIFKILRLFSFYSSDFTPVSSIFGPRKKNTNNSDLCMYMFIHLYIY